jgi:hypothetical protein
MNKYLEGDDDGVESTIFFGINGGMSFGESDQEHYDGLDALLDQSTSPHLEVSSDQKQQLSRDSIPLNRTSSCMTFALQSSEEKENDCCDTIRDDILYVRRKASILQRASYILLQQHRDYHKVACYNACIDEARRTPMNNKISIWDEAKHFLQTENDSPDEIHASQVATSFVTTNEVTSSMKSISAVHQYCISNRLEQSRTPPPTASPNAGQFVGPVNDATNMHVPKHLIDTSVVQCVTSTQYDTAAAVARPLSERRNREIASESANAIVSSIIDNWYNQTSGDVSFQRPSDKKRKRRSIATCKTAYSPSKTTHIPDQMNHGIEYQGSFCHSNNALIQFSEANHTFPEKSPLLPFHRILSSFNKPYHDEWKALQQDTFSRRN